MRLSLRVLRWGSALLAGIGLLVVWGVARHATVPTLLVRDIESTANWAFVQMRGVVIRYPAYDAASGYLSFWIDDGSGEVLVAAYRTVSRELVSAGTAPEIGDVATVRGTLRVKADSISLVLNAPEHLDVERPAAADVPIAQVDRHVRQKVRISGQVREVRTPYEGLTVLHVRDETGGIDVIYDQDMVSLSGAPVQVLPGDPVSVRGAVTLYKGRPQISLDAASGLQRVSQDVAVAAQRAVGEIGLAEKGGWVRVQGMVTEVHSLSAGSKAMLNDGTGAISVILWANLLDVLPDQVRVHPGAWLDVQGLVAEYRGELEVIPELACDVRALQPAQASSRVEEASSRTDNANADTTSGTDAAGAPDGGTPAARTETIVSLPSPTVTLAPLPTEQVAQQVALPTAATVTPTIVSLPSPTVTLAPLPTEQVAQQVALPTAATVTPTMALAQLQPEVSTGLLAAKHVGQRVTIRGRIVEATQFASGVKSYVDDGSGPVVVWMAQGVYEKLAAGAGWRVGSMVRVSGRVDQYKDEIEIVPQAAPDAVFVETAEPLAGPAVPISTLGSDRVGEWVTVEAEIVAVEAFSEGVKALLDDGSAQITLLLWQNVYDVVPDRERLIAGAMVRVAGRVEEYRGELEIVPGLGTDVLLVARQQ